MDVLEFLERYEPQVNDIVSVNVMVGDKIELLVNLEEGEISHLCESREEAQALARGLTDFINKTKDA